jgi:transposase
MTMHPQEQWTIPEDTKRVALAVFKKGNMYLKIADKLGPLYQDKQWIDLYRNDGGQSGISPARLALITIFQFLEGLTDRQAAEAVRSRIDWKYALGLELTDEGFDFSVLSEWRKRLIDHEKSERLLEIMLTYLSQENLIKQRGKQRTDSTHILAAIRQLNRLECVGETMRKVLNDLSYFATEWLKDKVSQDWFDLYSMKFEKYRLPKKEEEKEELAIRIGTDGYYLLKLLDLPETPKYIKQIESIEILRQVWLQQYYLQGEQVQWRDNKILGMPPNQILIQSPLDIEARNRTKRELNWTGYAVHLTETCDEKTPNLITNVSTTPATMGDEKMTLVIEDNLSQKKLLPGQHFVDSAYGHAKNVVSSEELYEVELIAPPHQNKSWQSLTDGAFPVASFTINWSEKKAICPMGETSISWKERQDKSANGAIEIRFSKNTCLSCQSRSLCTKSPQNPRFLKIRPQKEFELLQKLRQQTDNFDFKKLYNHRAGIEGTISQGTRSFGLRRSRYIGLAKTHLQNIAIACAINLTRLVAWLDGIPKESTRRSHLANLQ